MHNFQHRHVVKAGIISLSMAILGLSNGPVSAGQYVFSVSGTKTLLNGQQIIAKGVRCSNALVNDTATNSLIVYLDTFRSYGMNMISVYVMGSRYGNIPGYNADATLNPVYSTRLGKIVEAADSKGIVVLVGCLYWGTTTGKFSNWTQQNADTAIANTVKWAKSHNYRNVFFDPDNEGMAVAGSANIKNTAELVQSGKDADPNAVMASNYGPCPAAADLAIHISQHDPNKPYIQTEGAGIWKYGNGNYDSAFIGVYTAAQEQSAISEAQSDYNSGDGFLYSSMWLQAPPPYGPNANFGGDGITSPGVRWWADWLKSKYGPYIPPAPVAVTASTLLLNRTNTFDEVKIFDMRGRLLESVSFTKETAVKKLPVLNHAGSYLAVYSRGKDPVNVQRFCNPVR